MSEDSVEEQVNHYLGHAPQLFHIGTESSRTAEGEIWQSTVALVGRVGPRGVRRGSVNVNS